MPIAMICALPVGQNFAAYRVLHLKHYQFLGQLGDPDRYRNYTQWTWLEFFMYWGRLIIGYPIYITLIPILGFWQGNLGDRVWILTEFGFLLISTLFVTVFFSYRTLDSCLADSHGAN